MRGSGPDGLGPLLRLGIAGAGVAMFTLGVVAVFATSNGGGSGALVTVGAALALIAALGDRVEALELGSAKLGLRDLARPASLRSASCTVTGSSGTSSWCSRRSRTPVARSTVPRPPAGRGDAPRSQLPGAAVAARGRRAR